MIDKTVLLGGCIVLACGAPSFAGDICEETALLQYSSSKAELREELDAGLAVCLNHTDPEEFAECLEELQKAYAENKQLLHDQYEARLELCELLGGGAYDPEIDPKKFTKVIDNPYLPFPVGATWTYESKTKEGIETIEIEVLKETREILGVECVSVRDVVFLEGEPVEDTIDWYAQDSDGNVWYFGEISFNFEDGWVADIDGSWLSGVDGAKPGIVMLGDPKVDITYRQEWLLGEAEDAATVLDIDATVKIGVGEFKSCVKTHDFLPPEPDASEFKWYAPGIGFIYETKEDSDEVVELVSYKLPN